MLPLPSGTRQTVPPRHSRTAHWKSWPVQWGEKKKLGTCIGKEAVKPSPSQGVDGLAQPLKNTGQPARAHGTSTHEWWTARRGTKLHTQYLGRSAGDPNYVLGVQPGQCSRLRLSRVQGVKVLALVVAAPAVDLAVLGQSQAVGGACSHVNHLLP